METILSLRLKKEMIGKDKEKNKERVGENRLFFVSYYSTVKDLAKLRGLSTSKPFSFAT